MKLVHSRAMGLGKWLAQRLVEGWADVMEALWVISWEAKTDYMSGYLLDYATVLPWASERVPLSETRLAQQ